MSESLILDDSNESMGPLAGDIALLEKNTWAPWLTYSKDQLSKQRQTFGSGQFELRDSDRSLLGILSTNRINWSGDTEHLPTWNKVAGQELTYEDSFEPNGNTLALMSISVNPKARGRGIYRSLIRDAQDYARKNNLQHLIGDFRPSGFGVYKRHTGDFDFIKYCHNKRNENLQPPLFGPIKTKKDNQPQDPWLRAVKRLGMEELKPDARAMVVHAHADELDKYMQTYRPENWWKVTNAEQIKYLLDWHQPHLDLEHVVEVWECGETGTWYVDPINDEAVYIESNLWGELPIRTERYDLNKEELRYEELKLVQKVRAETKSEENVQSVWLHSYNQLSNIVRTWEAKYYPEIVDVVDDEVERHSAFLAMVDTRDGRKQLVHTARITSPTIAKDMEPTQNERSFFAGVDELVGAGFFTVQDFQNYYKDSGIDLEKCIGVETNQRVDKKTDKFNNLATAQMAYLSIFRLIASYNPEVGRAGIFACINRASLLSFRRYGLKFEPLMGREDLRYPAPGNNSKDYYTPVFIPYTEDNISLFKPLDEIVPQELFFDY